MCFNRKIYSASTSYNDTTIMRDVNSTKLICFTLPSIRPWGLGCDWLWLIPKQNLGIKYNFLLLVVAFFENKSDFMEASILNFYKLLCTYFPYNHAVIFVILKWKLTPLCSTYSLEWLDTQIWWKLITYLMLKGIKLMKLKTTS